MTARRRYDAFDLGTPEAEAIGTVS